MIAEQNKPLVATGWILLGVVMLCLEITIDVNTGIENATTEYQKSVMAALGVAFGFLNAISGITRAHLVRLKKHAATASMSVLLVLSVIYSAIAWLAFLSTMWTDYSKNKVYDSVSHQAKVAAINSIGKSDLKPIDANAILKLNKQLTAAEIELKQCNELKADAGKKNRWNKIQNCKNIAGAKYEGLNRELDALQNQQTTQLDSISKLTDLTHDNEETAINAASLPIAKMIAKSESGRNGIMLAIGCLITAMAIWLSNYSFYYVGQLIDEELQTHSPALQSEMKLQGVDFENTNPVFSKRHTTENVMSTALLDETATKEKNADPVPVFVRGKSESLIEKPMEVKPSNPIGFVWETSTTEAKTFKEDIEVNDSDRVKAAENAIADAVKLTKKDASSTQLSKPALSNQVEEKANQTGKGRGKDAVLEYNHVVSLIKSGDAWKYEDVLGTLPIQRLIKATSPNGAGVGTKKAAQIMTWIKEEGLPISKKEWSKDK